MRISDWSSDVCSSDLAASNRPGVHICRQHDNLGRNLLAGTTSHGYGASPDAADICPDLSGQCPHRSRVIAIGNSEQLMRILLTSPMGDPRDSKTWSSAPSNLARELIAKGVDIIPFDSRVVGKRSEERRVGKEGVSPCRSRWSQDQ